MPSWADALSGSAESRADCAPERQSDFPTREHRHRVAALDQGSGDPPGARIELAGGGKDKDDAAGRSARRSGSCCTAGATDQPGQDPERRPEGEGATPDSVLPLPRPSRQSRECAARAIERGLAGGDRARPRLLDVDVPRDRRPGDPRVTSTWPPRASPMPPVPTEMRSACAWRFHLTTEMSRASARVVPPGDVDRVGVGNVDATLADPASRRSRRGHPGRRARGGRRRCRPRPPPPGLPRGQARRATGDRSPCFDAAWTAQAPRRSVRGGCALLLVDRSLVGHGVLLVLQRSLDAPVRGTARRRAVTVRVSCAGRPGFEAGGEGHRCAPNEESLDGEAPMRGRPAVVAGVLILLVAGLAAGALAAGVVGQTSPSSRRLRQPSRQHCRPPRHPRQPRRRPRPRRQAQPSRPLSCSRAAHRPDGHRTSLAAHPIALMIDDRRRPGPSPGSMPRPWSGMPLPKAASRAT